MVEATARRPKVPFPPTQSHLRNATSAPPLSPRFYSFPSPGLPRSRTTSPRFTATPPSTPPAWSWSCHHCQATYPLGATRGCLYDGHYFCAGQTVNKRTGRVKRHKPCGSVFDYVGWKEYGDWRRNEERVWRRKIAASTGSKSMTNDDSSGDDSSSTEDDESGKENKNPSKRSKHDCEQACNFPSECRWRPRLAKEKLARSKKNTTASTSKASTKATATNEAKTTADQAICIEIEPGTQGHAADFGREPDTPMPPTTTTGTSSSPIDIGCRQSKSKPNTDLPAPLRIRGKWLAPARRSKARPPLPSA